MPLVASDAVHPFVSGTSAPACPAPLYLTSPYVRPLTAYGYEAMSLLLDAIRRGGTDRGAVIDEVLATENRASRLGSYSIDGFGDATLDRIGVESVRDCRRRPEPAIEAPR